MLIAMRRLNKEAQERTREVDAEVVAFALKPIADDLREKYAEHPQVVEHLGRVEADKIAHLDQFKPRTESVEESTHSSLGTRSEDDHFLKYRLNVPVDNSGTEGVPVIPSDNVKNLVLDERVVVAVRDGKFHVYAVSTIDEGIEVLTEVPAGRRDEEGAYPEGSIHAMVEERLVEMARTAKQFAEEMGARPTTRTRKSRRITGKRPNA